MTTTRSTTTVTATALLLVAALAGCGGGAAGGGGPTGRTSAAASVPPSSASGAVGPPRTAPDGSTIPDGTWAKTTTKADAIAIGVPPDVAGLGLGPNGSTVIELRIAGPDVAQFMEDEDDEGMVLGDRGTAVYDARGRWVLTSQSEGCSGCSAAFTWSVDGDRLTLRMDEVDSDEDPVEVLVGRAVMEGTFTRR